MDTEHKRFRAFISYCQRDKPIARRLHAALESYRIPAGVDASVGPSRALGRFFRDDDEMGASQSLGAALEGALDDSENLIVICSPSAARSKWVDAEVRRFKRRGSARVFAVIADGEPNAADPDRECFPPSLKVKIDADGKSTGEPDEPRAPDLRREGMHRVRAQVAAGLLDLPFDKLWQRDRRRTLRNRLLGSTAVLVVVTVLGVIGFGWLAEQTASRTQQAQQAVAAARNATADGRIGEALNRLAPFLEYGETRGLVEQPLRAMLGWIADPYASVAGTGVQAARLRDATVLLDPGRGVYDMSEIGLALQRLLRSRDGQRLVAVGDQRVLVFDAKSGQRLAQIDNAEVQWLGHAFETASGLIVVTGAVMGPTNGSVWPFALTVSADGKTVRRETIPGPAFFGSAVAITPKCDALLVAVESAPGEWRVESRSLTPERLGEAVALAPFRVSDQSYASGVAGLAPRGAAFQTADAFLAQAKRNPFTSAGCPATGSDDGFAAGTLGLQGARVASLEVGLSLESADRWTAATAIASAAPASAAYLPECTEAQPCPVVGGRTGETYVRDDLPPGTGDHIGLPPAPRWLPSAAPPTSPGGPIYFEHRVHNSGHQLNVCRRREGKDACLHATALGEDQLELPFLRSPDGRYLFWPFGGSVYDLETLQPLTASRAVPTSEGMQFDFEVDRPGLTLAFDGRLLSFVPQSTGAEWMRNENERASPRFGVLAVAAGERPLHTLASLGSRQYLAVRFDGVLARLDAVSGREVWRLASVGLGEIRDVQLDPQRRYVLLMGKSAWRVFRLGDGIALSGLLLPPPALEQPSKAATCRLQEALGPEGKVIASCGAGAFTWQPRAFDGDMAPQLARLTCATDVKAPALDTIRRCYLKH
jgi:hypothetical protein